MDSNRIKDIDARHGTQDENGNGARDAAIRKMGKEVQDLAGGSRENERGAHKNGRTREGAQNGMRGGARPGAGRPRGDSRMISFRAPGALADELEKVENRTEFIKKSIAEALLKKERVLKIAEAEENLEQGGISVTDIRRGWKTETGGEIESGKKSERAEVLEGLETSFQPGRWRTSTSLFSISGSWRVSRCRWTMMKSRRTLT